MSLNKAYLEGSRFKDLREHHRSYKHLPDEEIEAIEKLKISLENFEI